VLSFTAFPNPVGNAVNLETVFLTLTPIPREVIAFPPWPQERCAADPKEGMRCPGSISGLRQWPWRWPCRRVVARGAITGARSGTERRPRLAASRAVPFRPAIRHPLARRLLRRRPAALRSCPRRSISAPTTPLVSNRVCRRVYSSTFRPWF
jgi:hypothetical protein